MPRFAVRVLALASVFALGAAGALEELEPAEEPIVCQNRTSEPVDTPGCLSASGHSLCIRSIWSCLLDRTCLSDLGCWLHRVTLHGADIWRSLTHEKERSVDVGLLKCVLKCGKYKNPEAKTLCIAGMCAVPVLRCAANPTCFSICSEPMKALLACGPRSLKDKKFVNAAMCIAGMEDGKKPGCASEALDLLRDGNKTRQLACSLPEGSGEEPSLIV